MENNYYSTLCLDDTLTQDLSGKQNLPVSDTNNNNLQLHSISSVARILHLGRDSVRNLIKECKLPVIKIGKRFLIPQLKIEEFISESSERKAFTPNISFAGNIYNNSKSDSSDFSFKDNLRKKLEVIHG